MLSLVVFVALALASGTRAELVECSEVNPTTMTGLCLGVVFNLSTLVPGTGRLYFKSPQELDYIYYFQVADGGFPEPSVEKCVFFFDNKRVAAAQYSPSTGDCFTIGYMQNMRWFISSPLSDTGFIRIQLGSGDFERTAHADVYCASSQLPNINATENPVGYYNLILSSPLTCPTPTPPPPPPPTPKRPDLATLFTSDIKVDTDKNPGNTGSWTVDTSDQRSILIYGGSPPTSTYVYYCLERYDLGKAFTIDGTRSSKCTTISLFGPMSSPWSWLSTAAYMGRRSFAGQVTDVWATNLMETEMEVGVLASNSSVPVFYNTVWLGYGFNNITFTTFTPSVCLDIERFQIPASCKNSSFVANAARHPRPEVPEEYRASLKIVKESKDGDASVKTGIFAIRKTGLPSSSSEFQTFELDHKRGCYVKTFDGPNAHWFSWVAHASLSAASENAATWSYAVADWKASVRVKSNRPNQPTWVKQTHRNMGSVEIEFQSFEPLVSGSKLINECAKI